MSVSKWAYDPIKCDGDFCPGDCDICEKKDQKMVAITLDEAESLADWYERSFPFELQNDKDWDSMEWLANMCRIYDKCKKAIGKEKPC